ncbi:beta-galactosidase [Phytoactinopolyspora mesophila]|uniref:Beta-galactosidase n=1 Tax=Phytoactinopolyspora mesophila TaxID=2650750 RepID=A0A7K3LZV1_9ACTN|nr:beta-galactosidase [Phytoactinopolyspora mesophila]NDL55738.1 beta-galactosidase [Phytoactinopolyspora mesophila]
MADRSAWPTGRRIGYGGDYNPEQWPRETWDEDVALMREAGVNFVSVGIFSWALLEPREGEYNFAWLDDLLDLLHGHGIAVDLATPTASPPAWFFAAYPDARVVTRDGTILGFGSRGMASPSSSAYRAAAVRVASALASRYADHPAVVMWHVHNEYGAPVGQDYSEAAVGAFREWLRDRYRTLDALNDAWGTAFWGQSYGDWEHVGAPAATPSVANPAQSLDFARFTDHQLRACYIAERDAIREHAQQPITTNFMANECPTTDLWAWAHEVDIVSNDHYLTAADERGHVGLSLAADLTRSVAGGRPWILMEHSTSAVNWQPRNVAKRPGEMARNSLGHLARGADVIAFFQWRASRRGAEKFHSAMLPHAGTGSRIWREVRELGRDVSNLAELQGSTVAAEVALLWDTESFWAQDLEWRPSVDVRHRERVRAYYERLWRDGVTTDFAHPSADLSRYRLVVAPASYLLTSESAENLRRYVAGGGTLLVSFFSAVVDEHDAVHPGGFGAPLRDVLGLLVHEFLPLRSGTETRVAWADGVLGDAGEVAADTSQEDLALEGAEVVASHLDGPAAGSPAITRHAFGGGTAWYVSTRLDIDALAPVLRAVYQDAGVRRPDLPDDVEVVVRNGPEADYHVAINHGEHDVKVQLADGVELLSGERVTGRLGLPAGGVAVVRTSAERRVRGDHRA